MLLLNSQVENAPLMSLQSGSQLGSIGEPIIDPNKLQIIAYHVLGPRISGPSVIHTSDIREYGPLGFIVDSADDVMTIDEDLVRLQEVLTLHFILPGKLVKDDLNKRLGKVVDYTFEDGSYMVQKLHVSQSMMKNITSTNLIIHRSQIIEVTDTKIIVRSATIPKQVSLAEALNPFKKEARQFSAGSAK